MSNDIAIIGLAARFPKSPDAKVFWDNLMNGVNCIGGMTAEREKDVRELESFVLSNNGASAINPGGYLSDIACFDSQLFGIPPREADLMDPAQRIFLETVVEAIEDAGYGGERILHSDTGIFIGHINDPAYTQFITMASPSDIRLSIMGNISSLTTGRISHLFDLKGPCMLVDTACSSSLTAFHLACQSLRNGECSMAITGGVKLNLHPTSGESDLGISSGKNEMRVFGEDSQGIIWGEGAAAFLLKPLDKAVLDNDSIYAVYRGSAVNQDGNTPGMSAPNMMSQAAVIEKAWEDAGVCPETVTCIETHGTGTPLGDSIEIEAIRKAFSKHTDKIRFCCIGAVKANSGHLDHAAALPGLVKCISALKYGVIPPLINYSKPSKLMKMEKSPLFISTVQTEWRSGSPRRCGISSFGLSGTNCHMIFDEYIGVKDRTEPLKAPFIFTLSAVSNEALNNMVKEYISFLLYTDGLDMSDVCFTANTGRWHYNIRLAIVFESRDDLIDKLQSYFLDSVLAVNSRGSVIKNGKNLNSLKDVVSYVKNSVYDDTVNTYITRFIETGNQEELHAVCREYMQGARVDWNKLYGETNFRKVSLPTYRFERKRHWVSSSPFEPSKHSGITRKTVQTAHINLTGRDTGEFTDTEAAIAHVWHGIFGHTSFNVNDSFYALGGNSLLILRAIERIYENMSVTLKPVDFISHNTIEGLAGYIKSLGGGTVGEAAETRASYEEDTEHMYDDFPLTNMQFGYLFGRGGDYEAGNISSAGCVEFETKVDINRLNYAINRLISRHPMLRAVMSGPGFQRVLPSTELYRVTEYDISGMSGQEQEERLNEERRTALSGEYDTSVWPLFRFSAYRFSPSTIRLFVRFDMLTVDGRSMIILLNELVKICRDPEVYLPQINFTFRDYVMKLQELKKSELYMKSKAYWLERLDDIPPAPELPKKSSQANDKPVFSYKTLELTKELWDILKGHCQNKGITASSALCGLFARILAYGCNQSAFTLNMTIGDIQPFHKDTGNIVGNFTSNVLLPLNIDYGEEFWELAGNVQRGMLEALEYRHFDGIEVIRALSRKEAAGNRAVMPVVFTSLLFDGHALTSDLPNFGTILSSFHQTPQVYLELQAFEKEGCLNVTFNYESSSIQEEFLDFLFHNYDVNLKQICKTQPAVEKITLSPKDIRIIEKYNATYKDIQPARLDGSFKEQAMLTPRNTAIICGDSEITYENLDRLSDEAALYLRSKGAAEGDIISFEAERRIESIIMMLGILKSGAAFLPIDPDYPTDRKNYMLVNSGCKMFLDAKLYNADIRGMYCGPVSMPVNASAVAYIIYTSGSTGWPKDVTIQHNAAMNTITDINERFKITEKDMILGVSSLCFDLSVFDVFGSLSRGAALVLAPDRRDIRGIMDIIQKNRITVWNSVPAIMDMLADNAEDGWSSESLRLVMLSGDHIPLYLPERIKSLFPSSELISLGGATEASIWSIYYPVGEVCDEWTSIPYGYPLANQKLYILNGRGDINPIGVIGEIHIGGEGLFTGYANNEAANNQAFYPSPEFGLLYRTGDYGIMRGNGYIEFCGRKDSQVKIRGHRIELSEIEKKLSEISGVNSSAVTCVTTPGGKPSISACITGDEGLSRQYVESRLSESLPDYMLPESYIFAETMPLTHNGKIDREKLTAMFVQDSTGKELAAPENGIERLLLGIWEEVLSIERISVNDSFFNIGGNSMMVIKLETFLRRNGFDVSYKQLYTYDTIRKLAGYLA